MAYASTDGDRQERSRAASPSFVEEAARALLAKGERSSLDAESPSPQSETGVFSSTSTRKFPSRISAFFFSTISFTAAGKMASNLW